MFVGKEKAREIFEASPYSFDVRKKSLVRKQAHQDLLDRILVMRNEKGMTLKEIGKAEGFTHQYIFLLSKEIPEFKHKPRRIWRTAEEKRQWYKEYKRQYQRKKANDPEYKRKRLIYNSRYRTKKKMRALESLKKYGLI